MGGRYPVRRLDRTPSAPSPGIPGGAGVRAPTRGANDNFPRLPHANFNRDENPFRSGRVVPDFGRKLPNSERGFGRAFQALNREGRKFLPEFVRWLPLLDAVESALGPLKGYHVGWAGDVVGWLHQHWDYGYPYDIPPQHQEQYTYWSGPYGLTGQSVSNPAIYGNAPGDFVGENCNQFTWQTDNGRVSNYAHGAVRDSFARLMPTPGHIGDPLFIPEYAPGTDAPPSWLPNLDPLTRPGQAPAPQELPWKLQPHRVENPELSPTEQSHRGYAPRVYEEGDPLGDTSPAARESPWTETSIGPDPHAPPSSAPAGNPTGRTPPGRDTKEKKTIANPAAASAASKLVGAVTESLDALNAAYNALPSKVLREDKAKHRGKTPSPLEKLRTLYRHWPEIDPKKFLENLARNELTDRAIGRFNRQLTRYARPWYNRSRRPVGFGTGPAL